MQVSVTGLEYIGDDEMVRYKMSSSLEKKSNIYMHCMSPTHLREYI